MHSCLSAGSLETGPSHESDASDSEMFRVKQRSNLSLEKRRAGEMFSDVSQQQVCFFIMQFILLLVNVAILFLRNYFFYLCTYIFSASSILNL